MKIWHYIKTGIYVVASVLLCVFANPFLLNNLNYLIGGIMIAYGLEAVIIHLVTKKPFAEGHDFFWGVIEVFLGLALILYKAIYNSNPSLGGSTIDVFKVTCIIWAVWSILREADEIQDVIILWQKGIFAIINLLESLISIVFAALLLIFPDEHYALIYMYFLVAEFLTMVGLPYLDDYLLKKEEEKDQEFAKAVEKYETAVAKKDEVVATEEVKQEEPTTETKKAPKKAPKTAKKKTEE